MDYHLLLTVDELRALTDALHDTIRAMLRTTIARRDGAASVPDGTEHVRLHLLAFPVHEVAGVRVAPPAAPAASAPSTAGDHDDD